MELLNRMLRDFIYEKFTHCLFRTKRFHRQALVRVLVFHWACGVVVADKILMNLTIKLLMRVLASASAEEGAVGPAVDHSQMQIEAEAWGVAAEEVLYLHLA